MLILIDWDTCQISESLIELWAEESIHFFVHLSNVSVFGSCVNDLSISGAVFFPQVNKIVTLCFHLVDCILFCERFEFIWNLNLIRRFAWITTKSKCSSQLCESTLISPFRISWLNGDCFGRVDFCKCLLLDLLVRQMELADKLPSHLKVLLHPVVCQLTFLLEWLFLIFWQLLCILN